MFGLLMLAAFAVYLLVSAGVVAWSIHFAKRRGKSALLWGGGAAFLMYNLVFWDWIPTVIAHKYYCEKEAGFWVYKTLEQWKAENPGVMEGLAVNKVAPSKSVRSDDGHVEKIIYLLNVRFNWIVTWQDVSFLLPIIRVEQEVKDIQKGVVLARYVDFGSGNSVKSTIGPPGPLKFWLRSGNCSGGAINKSKLIHFADDVGNLSNQGKKK